jgi:hypothetical protein
VYLIGYWGRLHLRNTTEIRKIIYGWIAGSLSSTNNQLPAAGFAMFFTCNLPALDVLAYSVSMAVFRRCSFSGYCFRLYYDAYSVHCAFRIGIPHYTPYIPHSEYYNYSNHVYTRAEAGKSALLEHCHAN